VSSENREMLAQCDDRLDQELSTWVSQRAGGWSGTAAELLRSLKKMDPSNSAWPQSPQVLYSHLQSHSETLQALGIDVLLRSGLPRMVSLRPCQIRRPSELRLNVAKIESISKPPTTVAPVLDDHRTSLSNSSSATTPAIEVPNVSIPISEPDPLTRPVNRKAFEGPVFQNVGEALFAIVEMRRWIREENLDLPASVDLVMTLAQEIARSHGTAVGFLNPKRTFSPVGTVSHVSQIGKHFHAHLFQSKLTAGEAVQLRDAQKHPLLGAVCKQEGIGSVMIVPIFEDGKVEAAMEFVFREMRSFSSGDVMDLALIAGVIGENLGKASQGGAKHPAVEAEGPGTEPDEDLLMKSGIFDNEDSPGGRSSGVTTPAEAVSTTSSAPESPDKSSIVSKLVGAPYFFYLRLKRLWARSWR
jgi:hypothetical protein